MQQTEHEQIQNASPTGDDECLTVAIVAHEQKTSIRNVYRAIKRGELRAARINQRGDFRVYRSWVREWMRSRSTTA